MPYENSKLDELKVLFERTREAFDSGRNRISEQKCPPCQRGMSATPTGGLNPSGASRHLPLAREARMFPCAKSPFTGDTVTLKQL